MIEVKRLGTRGRFRAQIGYCNAVVSLFGSRIMKFTGLFLSRCTVAHWSCVHRCILYTTTQVMKQKHIRCLTGVTFSPRISYYTFCTAWYQHQTISWAFLCNCTPHLQLILSHTSRKLWFCSDFTAGKQLFQHGGWARDLIGGIDIHEKPHTQV